jgi:hypothetical protein
MSAGILSDSWMRLTENPCHHWVLFYEKPAILSARGKGHALQVELQKNQKMKQDIKKES